MVGARVCVAVCELVRLGGLGGLVRALATSSSAHERSAAAEVLSESIQAKSAECEQYMVRQKLRVAQRHRGAGGGGGQTSSSSTSSAMQPMQPGTDRFGERLRTLFRRSSFPMEKDMTASDQVLRQRVKVRQYEHGMVSEHPQQNQDTYFLPIRAFHLGRRIDFRRLAERYPHLPHAMQRDCLILDLTNRTSLDVTHDADAQRRRPRRRPTIDDDEVPNHLAASSASTTAATTEVLRGDDDGEDNVTIDDIATMVDAHSMLRPSYAVVYRYGSIVFFNVPDDNVRDRGGDEQQLPARSDGGMGAVSQMTSTSVSAPLSVAATTKGGGGGGGGSSSSSSSLSFQGELIQTTKAFVSGIKFPHCAEEYGVQVGSRGAEEDSWASISGDHVAVKTFDLNSVRVIGSVLGQSVALDHYANDVDRMLQIFTQLNEDMEKTGTFSMKKEHLFQLVATNNTTLTDLVNNLKLLDRSDTAWKYERYSDLWDELRKEFELEDRFETLEYKLNLVQHNVKFFLEILQNRKSDTLEWIIIILISGEILVSLYDIGSRLPGT